MRRVLIGILSVLLCAGFISACAKKAASGSEAISNTQTMQTTQQKMDYLISQGNAFLNSRQYEDAVQVARHVLADLDKNSAQAQSLIDKAMAQMKETAGKAMSDTQKKMGEMFK